MLSLLKNCYSFVTQLFSYILKSFQKLFWSYIKEMNVFIRAMVKYTVYSLENPTFHCMKIFLSLRS
jgi:hypothetical protein